VNADFPVEVVITILEMSEYWHWHTQLGKLLAGDGAEPWVLESTGDGVLPQPRLQVHGVKGSDATPQALVLPDFPGDEQRTATSNEVVTSRLTKEAVETVEWPLKRAGLICGKVGKMAVKTAPLTHFFPKRTYYASLLKVGVFGGARL
jgi:hypothetical protein